ncbi:MAG: glycosyltransferase [Proteobacteria bacterium]|nr:glycosyltransferase [Pseudomonadota bacterium]
MGGEQIDNREIVEKLTAVEAAFDVTALRYHNLRVWPLIRNALWWQLRNPSGSYLRRAEPLAGVFSPPPPETYANLLSPFRDTDLVFYSIADYTDQRTSGQWYHRHLDPIVELVNDRRRWLKVELPTPLGLERLPRAVPTLFVDPIQNRQAWLRPPSGGRIQGWSDLGPVLAASTGLGDLDEGLFVHKAETVMAYQEFFSILLAPARPGAVLMACWYYNLIGMALMWACRQVGAMAVDVQHGKQGSHHAMYSHWTRVPPEGWELLPEVFWTWGHASKDNIEKHQPIGGRHHRAVIGGNRWLGRFVEGASFPLAADEADFIRGLGREKKVVLVSLQWSFDELVPEVILEAMKRAPRHWLWLMRLHPMMRDQAPDLEALMRDAGVGRYEMTYATRCPLYSLLQKAHHHVTRFSSVCYEALAFGVPTTLVHPEGARLYADYVQRGFFDYAADAHALIRSVDHPRSPEQLVESPPYIETRPERALDAVNAIVSRSPNHTAPTLPDLEYREDTRGRNDVFSALASNQEGRILLEIDRPAEALTCFQRALRLCPGLAGVEQGRDQALLALERSRPALETDRTATRGARDDGRPEPAGRPEVSVILPTRNRPLDLGRAVRSVLAQSLENWELLVINDGGVDVKPIVESFQDHRVFYFHLPQNRGKAHALNLGLLEARGEYVAYLDDDDEWYPSHLETLARALARAPEIGAVYSDLYQTLGLSDPETGRRYPLGKCVKFSQDFKRDLLFSFNYISHVSLMHRRELVRLTGGYDENVRVKITWNMTRKLAFVTDILHVPRVTGEYWAPLVDSDRISDLERRDQNGFLQNLRRIKADDPPGPWPHVPTMAVLLPVFDWGTGSVGRISGLLDALDYPARLLLVNMDRGRSPAACRKALGELSELRNLEIIPPSPDRPEVQEACRRAAGRIEAEYVYLASPEAQPIPAFFLASALEFLRTADGEAVRIEGHAGSEPGFDMLARRTALLEKTRLAGGANGLDFREMPWPPTGLFRPDFLFGQATEHAGQGRYRRAHEAFAAARDLVQDENPPLMLEYYNICLSLERYDEAEAECRFWIEQGHGADNWCRLGRALQEQARWKEAIQAYERGLREIGFRHSDVEARVFPVDHSHEPPAFRALVGLGECMIETGRHGLAVRVLDRAAKLHARSHRPLLGLSRTLLAEGRMEQAEGALLEAANKDGSDPTTFRRLGELCEHRQMWDEAYALYGQAFRLGMFSSRNIEPLFRVGAKLGRWPELKEMFEQFLEIRPDYIPARVWLSDIDRALAG